MTIYRTFQINVLVPGASDALYVNPTLVLSGELDQGYPLEGNNIWPGTHVGIWVCRSYHYNDPVNFIVVLSSPGATLPVEIQCVIPVFGDPCYRIKNQPAYMETNQPTIFSPNKTQVGIDLVLATKRPSRGGG